MEAMGLSLGMVIVIAVMFIYLGLNRPIETGARMVDKELMKLEDEQTTRHDAWYVENVLDEATMAKADASRSYYSKRRKV
jgi:hypothetical protein